MHLYNTLTRKLEPFKSLKGKTVRIYTCGPTVYDFAHIGNFRSYVFADLLRRALEFFGYRVRLVMNITDVGHLISDADEGEDKMEKGAAREGKRARDIARFYTQAFVADSKKLNIKNPYAAPFATQYIDQQIEIICILEKKGFTYATSDGIYFDTAKFPNYGKLAGQKLEEKEAGARVEVNTEKRNPWDFALWKFSPKGKKREMEWPSPWGKGFPGWHIECSAMSRYFLGQPFDIHIGGVDHIPVHHTNEIAQSEAAFDVPLAEFWMHGAFLLVDDKRMGKSEGNLITVAEIERRGFHPLSYRYFALGAHYRAKLNFTWEALGAAQNALMNLYDTVRDWDKPRLGCAEFEKRFADAIADDLNTPQALAVMWELVKSDYPTRAKAKTLLHFDEVLGLNLKAYVAKPLKIPAAVKKLVAEREAARKEKDWAKSDALRGEIEKLEFTVEDTSVGPKVRTNLSVMGK